MSFHDLCWRHRLDRFLLSNARVRVSADRGKDIPNAGPSRVRDRNAASDLAMPRDSGSGSRVPQQESPKIPFERANVVELYTPTHRVRDTDKLFAFSIPGTCRRSEPLRGSVAATRVHKIARRCDPDRCRARDASQCKMRKALHLGLRLTLLACAPAHGTEIWPRSQASEFRAFSYGQVMLGRLLLFGPVPSGKRIIFCATCPTPDHASTDSLSLGIGEGGTGVGPERTAATGEGRNFGGRASWPSVHRSEHAEGG